MNGPYATEKDAAAEAMPRAIRDLRVANRVRSGDPERIVATTVMGYLDDAMAAASVQLGDFDRRIVAWLCGYEPTTVQVVLGLVGRAFESGRRSAPTASTETGR